MSKICYSPEGNPEMWDTCPEDYTSEKDWNAAIAAKEKEANDAAERERLMPENLRVAKLKEIDDKFTAAMSGILHEYTDAEASLFPTQAKDVEHYRATGNVTPFLRTLADARMITVDELVDKIEKRVAQYNTVTANLLGLRYYYKDAIDALGDKATTVQLLDLDIKYNLSEISS